MAQSGLTPFADPSDFAGGGEVQTDIRQLSEAMVPKDGELSEVWMKARLVAEIQPAFEHLMADAIMEGKVKMPFKVDSVDAGQALAIAHAMTTYAIDGKSQDTLTSIFGQVSNVIRRPFMGMRGRRSNYEDQDFVR